MSCRLNVRRHSSARGVADKREFRDAPSIVSTMPTLSSHDFALQEYRYFQRSSPLSPPASRSTFLSTPPSYGTLVHPRLVAFRIGGTRGEKKGAKSERRGWRSNFAVNAALTEPSERRCLFRIIGRSCAIYPLNNVEAYPRWGTYKLPPLTIQSYW